MNERISTRPFLLWHFSSGDKIENCPAQFLAVCWIVHVEVKLHRLRDGFSVSNALLLGQSLPAFIGHNLDQIGDGTLSSAWRCCGANCAAKVSAVSKMRLGSLLLAAFS